MVDLTYSKIFVSDLKSNFILQAEWGPENAAKILIVNRESAWAGELAGPAIRRFVEIHELQTSYFAEQMRAALGSPSGNADFLYSLNANIFSWKRQSSNGFIVKLGQMQVKSVPVPDTYELILERATETISSLQEKFGALQNENSQLRKDRDTALSKVTEFSMLKDEWERKLYGRFVAVLNTKKERIRILEEELGFRAAEQADEVMDKSDEWKADKEDQDKNGSPYSASTDVDTDLEADEKDSDKGTGLQNLTPLTSTLHRCQDSFSFDSPDSPASPLPVLPKRLRCTNNSSSATSRNVFKKATKVADPKVVSLNGEYEDDDEMKPVTLQESTQDLLDNM